MTLIETFWERYELGQGSYLGQRCAVLPVSEADKNNWPELANYSEVFLSWDGRDEFGSPIGLYMAPVRTYDLGEKI